MLIALGGEELQLTHILRPRPQIQAMADSKRRLSFSYSQSSVHVYTDQVLGTGSYRRVYKAKVDNFICATKALHPVLSAGCASDSGARRFQEECEFLSALKHPNIVQYLGVHVDPVSKLPLLLMELMNDENLTQFLANSPRLLPFHVQVNISHDVSQALSYLHSNRVIHRDLSGSNVLLIGTVLKAKVCDFGMAKLLEINPSYRQSLTMCPGNAAYMAPEALRDNPKYDEKLDCFSFGVLVVQILTGVFPQPGDRNEQIKDSHYGGTVVKVVPEIERRRNHIGLVNPHNLLLHIALECLIDDPFQRPSSQQLCEKVVNLKECRTYRESEAAMANGEPAMPEPSRGYPSMPETVRMPQTKRHERVQESEGSLREIISLREQIKQKDAILEDVFVNSEVQEKFLAEARAKLEEEKRNSGQLRQLVSQHQAEVRQLYQELAYYKKQCEEIKQQCLSEQQQQRICQSEVDRLRQESIQTGNLILVLQQQLSEVKSRESKCQKDLSQTNSELSKLRQEYHEVQGRATREKNELSTHLREMKRESSDLNVRLQEAAREISQLRDDLSQVTRGRDTASQDVNQKDRQIREVERRLEQVNISDHDSERRSTQLQQILPSGDSWNVPRDKVEILHYKEIGRGATGLIVEGRYHNQPVAVKQIHKQILSSDAVVNEFKREVRIMASIKHPNLVRFIAAVFDDDVQNLQKTPLLILELLHTDLRKAYQHNNIDSQQQKISIFRDVAYGLHYLHEHQQPIVHRDVSAPNVLLESLHGAGSAWRAKLSDFGSANFLKDANTLGVGALVYTAPEMFPQDGARAPMPSPTTKCDVFSYGIVIVEVVSKAMPTPGSRHVLISEIQTRWPSMYDLVSRCTETSPDDRPTMSDVLDALNRIPIARPRYRSFPS